MTITRKHPLAECEKCPLAKKDCAPTSGSPDAEVAFVSRSPGVWDAQHRKPFAGPSGRVLDHLLKTYGYTRNQILLTNVVLCETDDPPAAAIEACRPRLEHELQSAATILAGGVEAVHALIDPRTSISSARGRIHKRTVAGGRTQRVVATSNPAVVLRESNNFPDLVRDFRLALDPVPPPTMPKVWHVDSVKEGLEVINDILLRSDRLASDLETYGYSKKIACAGFAASTDLAYVFGIETIDRPEIRKALKMLYEKDLEWVWHNGKYDVKVLARNGINGRIDQDTFILSYALDERPGGDYQGDQGAGLHALTPTLMANYGWKDYEYESVKKFKKTQILENPQELYDYNGKDTVGTLVLLNDLVPSCVLDEVYERPYLSIQVPLANSLIPIELRGFCYDVESAADLNEIHVRPMLATVKEQLREISGFGLLNPNSPKQLQVVYYEHFGLKHDLRDSRKRIFTTSTGKEVRKEVMEGRFTCKPRMQDKLVEFATLHEQFAKVDKQRSTSFEGLIEKVAPDGKLYSTFKFGTVTGRTSSENPNFQNITRAGSYGLPSIRSVFKASPGHTLVQADYSQAELRTIAKLSGDVGLLGIYRDATRSLHKERAARFYGEDYTYEEYVKAKNINFGVTYGQSAFAFSQMYNMPIGEAQDYIETWFRDFPGIVEWIKETQIAVQRDAYIQSPFGHKRRFHLLTKENKDDVFREAVNFKPQNIAGVLTEYALVELVKAGVPITTTVHDSIVADVPNERVYDTAVLMKQIMEDMPVKELGWQKDDIPFLVDISVGNPWSDVKEVENLETLRIAA